MDSSPRSNATVAEGDRAVIAWIGKHSLAIFLALVLIASLRIIATYNVFSHTWDEPDHIAAGTEWLTDGNLHLDYSHPPLARVAEALGPYLASGLRGLPGTDGVTVTQQWDDASLTGLAILDRDAAYDRNLALARLGVLPFFWIACGTVYLWARRYLGEPSAALAVFFFTFLPPVLAHAGLATTDMALTAFVGASFLMTVIWIEKPTRANTVLLGIIVGLAVLSKFSSLPYLPVALAAAFLWHKVAKRPTMRSLPARRYLAPLAVSLLICCVVVWGGYRFSFGPVAFPKVHQVISLPAPEFFQGLQNLARYNKYGHGTFLLGQYSTVGWWYFFPVVLAVKTPIPFLMLTLFGAIATTRKKAGVWLALAFSLGIFLFTLLSHLNFGVRHILPVYMGFSIVAGAAAERMLRLSTGARWTAWLLGALLIWMVGTSAMSHPDYLAYFNAFAGGKPEKILVDSDLDWGQDMKRLSQRLKQVHASSLSFTPYDPVDLKAMGFPPVSPLNEAGPTPGWNAVSLTRLKLSEGHGDFQNAAPWEEKIAPKERIGKGIWLWYFSPNAAEALNHAR